MGKIYVVDSIMGSGKTQAAITFMLSHPDYKFLFVTPFLTEVLRICEACKDINMISAPLSEKDKKKLGLIKKGSKKTSGADEDDEVYGTEDDETDARLIMPKRDYVEKRMAEGCNMAITHVLFKMNTMALLESIRKYNYVLIIDEAIDTLEKIDFDAEDISILEDAGRIERKNGALVMAENSRMDNYKGKMVDIINKIKQGALVEYDGEFRFWSMSEMIFEAARATIVMTYKFDYQLFKYYFDICQLDYEKIGVYCDVRGDSASYQFCKLGAHTIPEYASHLSDMINIIERESLNDIGDDKFALSHRWFKKNLTKETGNQLRRNLDNMHFNITRGISPKQKLWASCKIAIKDFGVGRPKTKRGGKAISFNYRASNDYAGCTVFSYLYNVFMNVDQRRFINDQFPKFDSGETNSKGKPIMRGVIFRKEQDQYGLSVMLQCMWRTAIRNGQPITVYVPSKRMRDLLKEWIVEVEEEYRQYKERATGELKAEDIFEITDSSEDDTIT